MTLAASGTAAIIGALLAVCGRAGARRLAAVPAFTFVATALAVEQCGFEPCIIDVERDTWSIQPRTVERAECLPNLGIVVPVAPFGRAVEQAPWIDFQRRTGVPVIIDGGASFEALVADPATFVGPIPVALSFHTTKSFSTAEGGAVVTTNVELGRRVAEALNFGFSGSGDCSGASTFGGNGDDDLDWEDAACSVGLSGERGANLRERGLELGM